MYQKLRLKRRSSTWRTWEGEASSRLESWMLPHHGPRHAMQHQELQSQPSMSSAVRSYYNVETFNHLPPYDLHGGCSLCTHTQSGQASVTLHTVPRNLLISPHTHGFRTTPNGSPFAFRRLSSRILSNRYTGKSGYRRVRCRVR
jgi:hypothetical protein